MGAVVSTMSAIYTYFNPPPTFANFLSLPIELRLKIYTLALPTGKHFPFGPGPYWPTLENDRLLARIPSLLQVSRQIRSEALPIFYGENCFYIALNRENWKGLVRWLDESFDDFKASCTKQLSFKEGEYDTIAEVFPDLPRAQPGERMYSPPFGKRLHKDPKVNWAEVKRCVWDEIETENATVRPDRRVDDTGLRRKQVARLMFILGRDLGFIDRRPWGLLKRLCESNEPGFT